MPHGLATPGSNPAPLGAFFARAKAAMVVGAFTNSSLFLLPAMFPVLDGPPAEQGFAGQVYFPYLIASILTTSYGFGKAAVTVLRSTFEPASGE